MPLSHNVESIERISVHSRWLGFANPCLRLEDLEVVRRNQQMIVNSLTRRTNDGPDTDARAGDTDTVAPTPEALEQLLLAIEKPPLEHPWPENLGVDLQSRGFLAKGVQVAASRWRAVIARRFFRRRPDVVRVSGSGIVQSLVLRGQAVHCSLDHFQVF